MNSFDEVQCEETADAQMIFNMEEMAFMQQWDEEQDRKAQEELDYLTDLMDAELDF